MAYKYTLPDLDTVLDIARGASAVILKIYNQDFSVSTKSDSSPLTEADMASNGYIVDRLKAEFPDIPIISEETKATDYSARKDWELSWIVDPLDGTKEFIKRNGEFTVNIGLARKGKPVLGVVHIPAMGISYLAAEGAGSFKVVGNEPPEAISTSKPDTNRKLVVMGSRSHGSPSVEAFLEAQREIYPEVEYQAAGSALKICYVAEGRAHVYPRFGPTMEWDTAAGQAVVELAGGSMVDMEAGQPLQYNKEDLLNPHFIVRG